MSELDQVLAGVAREAERARQRESSPQSAPENLPGATDAVLRDVLTRIPEEYREARVGRLPIPVELNRLGYCLRGPTGIGKTYAATALAIEFARRLTPSASGFVPASALAWATCPWVVARLRSSCRQGAQESEYAIICELAKVPILLLDDVGAEKTSDFTAASLYAIVSERRNWRRPTIITTNQSLEQINQWEPRLASRFGELGELRLPKIDRRNQIREQS